MWIALNDYRLLPAVSGIYVIRHRESGREYVGQSKNVRKRMVGHRAATSPHYLGRALRLHGLDAFEVCFLASCIGDMGELERQVIAERGTFAPAGYNASLGGLGPTGMVMTTEWRAAQSARVKGVPLTPETKAKMRESALANNAFRGKKHSDKTKTKMAEAAIALHTGKKRSDQARANISASLVGRVAPVLSAEARERQAASQRRPNPKKSQPGSKNGMYGVKGSAHPAARAVLVWPPESMTPHTFDCAVEAAQFLGIRPTQLSGWLSGYRVPLDGTCVAYLK